MTVIDDNSSFDDRVAMARAFPTFRFVHKPASEAGHARSMNLALALTRSSGGRFLLYLEDDWLVRNDTGDGNMRGSTILSQRLRGALELGACPSCAVDGGLEVEPSDERVPEVLLRHL